MTRKPLGRGIHSGVPMERYIADPCRSPSISTRIVQAMIDRSPLHAATLHPRIGTRTDSHSPAADRGSAAHGLLLGGAERISYWDGDDWRKADARAFRDAAHVEGRIPMLERERGQLEDMAGIAKDYIMAAGLWGLTEQTMVWDEKINGSKVWARTRPDILPADAPALVDYKTAKNSDPRTWIRKAMGGYEIQGEIGLRGAAVLEGPSAPLRDFIFVVQEVERPFACSLIGIAPSLREIARQKVDLAFSRWAECSRAQVWPCYDTRIHWAEAPAWMEHEWEERKAGQES